jgi:hypothetical protein
MPCARASLARQLVFHQREAHHVQAKIGCDGSRDDRLAEPLQVDGTAGWCHVMQAHRAAPAGHLLLRAQQATALQPA